MIQVDMVKAKEIAHAKRREARSLELSPLDVQVTIPTLAEQTEIERQKIRDKYAEIQVQIDEANSVDALKDIITKL